jgi:glutathione S-transferase
MVLEIYLDPFTINSRKVLAGLDLMGVDYHLNYVSWLEGKMKDPEFVKNINPSATVPAAVDGDLHLTESNAILMYAADLKGHDAYPKDLKTRAAVNRWSVLSAGRLLQAC